VPAFPSQIPSLQLFTLALAGWQLIRFARFAPLRGG
jgi:hypothetical protein